MRLGATAQAVGGIWGVGTHANQGTFIMANYTRRTVVRGAAWTVPVIAVAAPVPAFATSHEPPPPSFDFKNGYKNPGESCKLDCIPKWSYGVPVSVQNNSGEDYYIQFTSYFINGNNVGVFGLTTGIVGCPKNFPAFGTPCTTSPALTPANSVRVPSGTSLTIYVTSNGNGSSPQGGQAIDYRWIRANDCVVTSADRDTSLISPPNVQC